MFQCPQTMQRTNVAYFNTQISSVIRNTSQKSCQTCKGMKHIRNTSELGNVEETNNILLTDRTGFINLQASVLMTLS